MRRRERVSLRGVEGEGQAEEGLGLSPHLARVVVGSAAEDVAEGMPGEGPDAALVRSLLSALTSSDGLIAVGGPVENGPAARGVRREWGGKRGENWRAGELGQGWGREGGKRVEGKRDL
eukprot:768469-Hanusia_phi.AAC.3